MYYQGDGIEQDKQKAVYWYTKAAKQNHSEAQYNLALMYEKGEGVKQDKEKAIYWYRSEERRVGKEYRSRWWRNHRKHR